MSFSTPPKSPSHWSKQPKRPAYRAARAFYLTLFIGACFATYAILIQSSGQPRYVVQNTLRRRDLAPATNDDEQCRLVHQAKDQCTFVHSQCPSEEPGFSAYLDLYYCRLAHVKAIAFIILITWLALLFSTIGIAASDFFCINLSTIATILGMSESMAGVTFLAFGNGSPDVFSTFAAMSTNSGSLAVGELFGAAGFITAVVSGSMALIRPFHVARKSFVRDVGFFMVAAAFSIVFLWDGKLHFWECMTMILFYCFYVAFVVLWHWWYDRRRRRRERERAAREHFVPPEELIHEEEEYHDDPEDRPSSRPSPSRVVSWEDWSALERAAEGHDEERDEDEEEEARDRWMSELNSNMRLTRPPARPRGSTLTPVRPSLVGALEFQAVLKSLQKSRNIQTIPMNTRRYSDHETYTTAQQQDQMSSVSDPASRPPYQLTVHEDESPTMERLSLDVPASAPTRNRAVSANDAEGLRIDPELQQRLGRERSRSPHDENLIDLDDSEARTREHGSGRLAIPDSAREIPSPTVEVSPATPRREAPIQGRRTSTLSGPKSPQLLAPPGEPAIHRSASQLPDTDSPGDSPRSIPNARTLPKIVIPGRERSRSRSPAPQLSPFPQYRDGPTSPFPRYRDDPSPPGSRSPSFRLPPPASPESLPVSQSAEQAVPKRPTLLDKWWPYSVLPPPGVMISTLFPTIYHWHEKNYWEKALGIVAAPSVFLLTITLPVVESAKDDEDGGPTKDASFESGTSRAKSASKGSRRDNSIPIKNSGTGDVLNDPIIHIQEHGDLPTQGAAGQGTTTAKVATAAEQQHSHGPSIVVDQHEIASSPVNELEPQLPELWNRWLLIVQLFLAPLFIVLAVYSQSPIGISPTWLIKPILICLLVSLVLLVPLLLTTTPTHKPIVYRYVLSLVGFVVSIAWISTIASQVVGALKALAVILNMSHAIMGLTIFAVGNSLGDLVADVTVAKLGYPVMALSACFGGPMLNILLGIGLSGSYILITGAQRRQEKHPDKEFYFKSYHIEVSNTLIVSGATLLVTLIGLLIAVPMNKWVFSKRIGWTLIAVWILSTVGNVVIELTGLANDGGHREDLRVGG